MMFVVWNYKTYMLISEKHFRIIGYLAYVDNRKKYKVL